MSRSIKIYLQDIIDAIHAIRDFMRGADFDAFSKDVKLQAAVQFKLVVIGEAASKVPYQVRKQYPAVDWRKVVGMRNIVAHGYFGVKLELLWDAITRSIEQIEGSLGNVDALGDDGIKKSRCETR